MHASGGWWMRETRDKHVECVSEKTDKHVGGRETRDKNVGCVSEKRDTDVGCVRRIMEKSLDKTKGTCVVRDRCVCECEKGMGVGMGTW